MSAPLVIAEVFRRDDWGGWKEALGARQEREAELIEARDYWSHMEVETLPGGNYALYAVRWPEPTPVKPDERRA